MIDMDAMKAELDRDEGLRLHVYDDFTGEPIRPGSLVRGHPTIGVGRALDVHGITAAESAYLLDNDINSCVAALAHAFHWWPDLEPVRQRVLVNMAFNMGMTKLLKFVDMIAAIEAQNWDKASAEILDSKAARDLPERYERLAEMMRTGKA